MIAEVVTAVAVGVAVDAVKPHAARLTERAGRAGKRLVLSVSAQAWRFLTEALTGGRWAH